MNYEENKYSMCFFETLVYIYESTLRLNPPKEQHTQIWYSRWGQYVSPKSWYLPMSLIIIISGSIVLVRTLTALKQRFRNLRPIKIFIRTPLDE
jgi:hypothetical protein